MRTKTMLFAMLFAVALCGIAYIGLSDDASADPEDEYGAGAATLSTTTFVIGETYDHVFVCCGNDPQGQYCLDGMTVVEEDGRIFASGSPECPEIVQMPYYAGESIAYIMMEAVEQDDSGYAAGGSSSITLKKGVNYNIYLDYRAYVYGTAGDRSYSSSHYGLTVNNTWILTSVPTVTISGTATQTGSFSVRITNLDNTVDRTYNISIIDGGSSQTLVSKINISGDDHNLGIGGTISMTATTEPSNADYARMAISYYNGSASIATYNKDIVDSGESLTTTGVSYGSYSIRFRAADQPYSSAPEKSWKCWVEQKCTITLDYDSGVSDDSSFKWSNGNKVSGSNTFTLKDAPTRSGYIFEGWTIDGTTYQPGKTISVAYALGDVTKTVTAQWTKEVLAEFVQIGPSKTMTANAGADRSRFVGYAVANSTSDNTCTDKSVSAYVYSESSSGVVSVTTKDSISYSTNKVTSTEIFITPLKKGTATVRVTADNNPSVYADISVTVNGSITITYDANNGTGQTVSDSKTQNSSTSLRSGSALGFTKEGYKPGSYNTRSDGTGTTYSLGATVTPSDNMYLYVQWVVGTYTVYFDSNGGSYVGSGTFTNGRAYYQGGWPSDPTKEGSTFQGWYKDSSLTTKVNSTDIVDITSDTTFYAKWSQNASYTVKYYRTNSTNSTLLGSEQVYSGGYATQYINGIAVTGYDFVKWLDFDGFAFTSSTKVTGDKNVYGVYNAKMFTLSFNTDGGTQIGSITVTYGQKYNQSSGWPADPTKNGFTFLGWYKDANLTQSVNGDSTVDITSSTTFYAKWGAVQPDMVKITYHRSTIDSTVLEMEQIQKGSTITKTSGIAVIGYTWQKWVTANGSDFSVNATVQSDLDLYGVYSAKTFTVSFNTDGGSSVASATVTYGQKYNQSPSWPTSVPTKTGFTFLGWFKDANLTQSVNGDSTVDIISNATFYAKWAEVQPDKVTVTYYRSTIDQTMLDREQIQKGSTITLKNGYAIDGYTWQKWILFNGTDFDVNAPVQDDLSLYGVYQSDSPDDPVVPTDDTKLSYESESTSNGRAKLTFYLTSTAQHTAVVWTVDGQQVPGTSDVLVISLPVGVHSVTAKLVNNGQELDSAATKSITVLDNGDVTEPEKDKDDKNSVQTIAICVGVGLFVSMFLSAFVLPRF